MLRIGLLTSGGDCQALNATMRGIVKTLMTNSEEPIEIYGFEDGYQGLIYSRFRVMTPADFSGILTRGGTILGTSRMRGGPKNLSNRKLTQNSVFKFLHVVPCLGVHVQQRLAFGGRGSLCR